MKKVHLLSSMFVATLAIDAHAVTITENYDPVTDNGDFNVTNTDGLAGVVAFAVANNTGFDVDGATTSGHGLWTAGLITDESWNFGNMVFGAGSIFVDNMSDTFSASTTQAFIYWVPDHAITMDYIELPDWDIDVNVFEGDYDGGAQGIFPFVTAGPFGFSATSAGSPCVALLSDGSTQSCVTVASAVPLPGAVWLFGSALLGLIGLSRTLKTS